MAMTEADYDVARKRRAWWLFVARICAGMNQAGVAVALGMSENSASTVSDWERGTQEPSLRQLHDLAVLYEVPLATFTSPGPTDEETIEEQTGHQSRRTDPVEPRGRARTSRATG